jgi:5-hydroxyisourate hydrolase
MGISTHILDTSIGRPAAGVPINLSRLIEGAWLPITDALTDTDGRCKQLLPETEPLRPGTYRIHFATSVYYVNHSLQGLYPYVEIVFDVSSGDQHFHIPLLLTANGYTTYRGS